MIQVSFDNYRQNKEEKEKKTVVRSLFKPIKTFLLINLIKINSS
jgi:hypothetical protein